MNLENWKTVLGHIKGTFTVGVTFRRVGASSMVGYSDPDWRPEIPSLKSISYYVFIIGKVSISWRRKQHTLVAKITVEAVSYFHFPSVFSDGKSEGI